jgi:hypothetical protein
MPDTDPISDAARVAAIRDLLPTTLGSAEIRGEIAADLRARSVFVSRAANVVFLSKVKEVIDAVADGKTDKGSARVALLETLRALNYTPEGGFPDDPPGEVPEAIAGTLQDLTSFRRMSLIVDTQAALMNGRGQQLRGMETTRMDRFPAYELVRVGSRREQRNWASRWAIAGGRLYGGRMIALKGDAVWGELGASANFNDALDTDHPPFAFGSGMGWREVGRAECVSLGVTGPDGETLEQWLGEEHPVLSTLSAPAVDMSTADPGLVQRLTAGEGAVRDGTSVAMNPDAVQRLRDRMAAIDARRAELRGGQP